MPDEPVLPAEDVRPVHAPGVPCGAVVTPDDLVTSHRLFVTCFACLEAILPQAEADNRERWYGPHEHVYRCQDCGEIGRAPRDWDAEPTLYDPDTGVHEA